MTIDFLPSWLIFASFGLSMLVGLGLIVLAQFHKPQSPDHDPGPLMELKLPGGSLKATRVVMQAAFGILLLTMPVIFVYAMGSRTPVTVSVAPNPKDVKTVEQITDPSYEGFFFRRDVSVLDLRASRDIPAGKKDERYSPVTLINNMLVTKTRPERTIRFTYATSGVAVSPRCLTHPYELKKAMKPDVHGERKLREVWEIEIDVADIPMNEEFLLTTEVTYWNAFEAPEQRNYSTYANDQTEPEEVSMILLFPESKPLKKYDLFAYEHETEKIQPFQGTPKVTLGKDNSTLYWRVPKAQPGYAYEVHWEL
jgi:hypothetical protein